MATNTGWEDREEYRQEHGLCQKEKGNSWYKTGVVFLILIALMMI